MPQFRKDPIVNRWVIISAERALRPSDFTGVVGEESKEVAEAKGFPAPSKHGVGTTTAS